MNEPAISLDRLHDIVMPAPVPVWPPAPGWYTVIAAVVCCLILTGYRSWRTWRANAYRRTALRDLQAMDDIAQMAELLRRVALVIAPRSVVAAKTGEEWPDWLAARCPETMPDKVRAQLAIGIYSQPTSEWDSSSLRKYAATWISRHQYLPSPAESHNAGV